MRVCLDNIIFSLQRNGGISVYWAQLLQYLFTTELGVHVVERHDALQNRQRQCLEIPGDALIEDTRLLLQAARYLPVFKPYQGSTIFHSSYYRIPFQQNMKRVITVYDFTYEFYVSGLKRLVHSSQKQRALQGADRIICISQNTADDLLTLYPSVAPERVRVIHLGCSSVYSPVVATLPHGFEQLCGKKFILFVGDRGGYKNFDMAVRAVEMLDDFQLVAVGGKPLSDVEQKRVDEQLAGRFMYAGHIPDHLLNSLYNQAFCLLYPSAYEGFGLPPLEAMQAGCPVVACRRSSLPEICGEGALLVDTPCPKEFAAKIELLQADTTRQGIRTKAFHQAKKFSWLETCRKTIDVYEELAHRHNDT